LVGQTKEPPKVARVHTDKTHTHPPGQPTNLIRGVTPTLERTLERDKKASHKVKRVGTTVLKDGSS
jgi:hypothetical protein